jgi:hypothetical protein
MEMSGQLHAPAVLPTEEESQVPVAYEAGWVSKPVFTLWCREKSFDHTGILTPVFQALARHYTD